MSVDHRTKKQKKQKNVHNYNFLNLGQWTWIQHQWSYECNGVIHTDVYRDFLYPKLIKWATWTDCRFPTIDGHIKQLERANWFELQAHIRGNIHRRGVAYYSDPHFIRYWSDELIANRSMWLWNRAYDRVRQVDLSQYTCPTRKGPGRDEVAEQIARQAIGWFESDFS